jgi:hypothetical protein
MHVGPFPDPARRRVVLGSIVAAGLLAAVLVLLLGSSPATHAGPSDRIAATATDDLTANLAVLRRPTTATDTLPAHLVKALEAIPGGSPEPELARRAAITSYGQSVYVVPTESGRACLVDSDLSEVVCAGLPEISEGNASAGNACLPGATTEVEVAGLLPDDAQNPALLMSDGNEVTLPMHENTYVARFARGGPLPSRIMWTDSSGAQSAPTALPLDAGSVKCARPDSEAAAGAGSDAPERVTVHHNPG